MKHILISILAALCAATAWAGDNIPGGAAFESAHNKAWLALPAATRTFLALPGYDEANGIDNPQSSIFSLQSQDDWFTLDGRRLGTKPANPGIYVQGGRKVVVR